MNKRHIRPNKKIENNNKENKTNGKQNEKHDCGENETSKESHLIF